MPVPDVDSPAAPILLSDRPSTPTLESDRPYTPICTPLPEFPKTPGLVVEVVVPTTPTFVVDCANSPALSCDVPRNPWPFPAMPSTPALLPLSAWPRTPTDCPPLLTPTTPI